MSRDDDHFDHDGEGTPHGLGEPPSGRGAFVWITAVAVVLAAAGVGLADIDLRAAAFAAAAVVLTAWATRPAATEAGLLHRRTRTVRRLIWPDAGMKTVIDAIDDPTILTDAGGVVRYVNREAITRFGALRLGDPLSFRLRVTVLLDALDQVVTLGRSETVEWTEKIPTERWFRAHLAPIRHPPDPRGDDRPPDFVLILIEDLTESRRVERMRADFVANASHELRTPLAAVSGFVETLQGPAKNDAAARERFLAVMAEQAGRMRRLIDDLLSLSRVEMRAHLRPETRVDLADILPQVVDLTAPNAGAAGVTVTLRGADRPCVVRGDREELIQVFVNLVENALKYGGDGRKVEIALTPEATACTVAVRDWGRGIAPEHLPRLTERFYRAHEETSGAKRGTGLGLAIVKHIVTRHGGRLTIDSRLGEGSTFTVRFDRESGPTTEKIVKKQSVDLSRN